MFFFKVPTNERTNCGTNTISMGVVTGLGVLVVLLVLIIALLIGYIWWLRRRGQ